MLSKKVILTGNFGVGKTSLFQRFIKNTFSDRYLTTIGVKVDKKEVEVDGKTVSLIIWDIAGEIAQTKVPNAYFLGASSIIYVFDLTRPRTYQNMEQDLQYLQKVLPNCLIKVVGNKKDLIPNEEIERFKEVLPIVDHYTSAKTGEEVEILFMDIGRKLLN